MAAPPGARPREPRSRPSWPTCWTCCAWRSRPGSRRGARWPRSAAAIRACSPRELRRAAGRATLGVPAAAALDELERRCPARGIAPLAAALRRAERHGAPLAPTLAAQAAEARARRAQQAAEAAARAAPQIQLVVALLLVPAVMLLVAAAMLPALTGAPT